MVHGFSIVFFPLSEKDSGNLKSTHLKVLLLGFFLVNSLFMVFRIIAFPHC